MGVVLTQVAQLVRAHSEQSAVEFKSDTWRSILSRWPAAERVLTDDRYSKDVGEGRRIVSRNDLRSVVADMDLAVSEEVQAAFTLVVVWGSGVRSRSYRYLPLALAAPECVDQLRASALSCRAGDFAGAYARMRLAGVGPAFFTKWFAFAGVSSQRVLHPLILDARVRRTLTSTLGVDMRQLGGRRMSAAARYVAYVELVEGWAASLRADGMLVSAEEIEFALFAHNGNPVGVGAPA